MNPAPMRSLICSGTFARKGSGLEKLSGDLRYAHTNIASKREAVKNLLPSCDNLVTMPRKMPQGLQIDGISALQDRRNGRVVEGGGLENR